jgi:hypothetical protein
MRSRLRLPPWFLAAALCACEEGEISLLEASGSGVVPDAPACDPDPRSLNACPDAGAGATAGTGGTGGTAGTTADAGACQTRADCTSGGRPICNTAVGRCVECALDTDCDSDEVCDSVSGECTQACRMETDCTSGDRPHCDVPRRACVQCRDDFDCRPDDPRCFMSECVECVDDGDCRDPSHPRCADDHQCREP